jgi:hypothetical protein
MIALAFAAAWVACVLVEPMPDGPHPDPPLWSLPLDLASLATLVAAVVSLWRGGRRGASWGIAAGTLMAVETVLCPVTGHHMVGPFIYVQAVLSVAVLLTSAALPAIARRWAAVSAQG